MSRVYDNAVLSNPGMQNMPVSGNDWSVFVRTLSTVTSNGYTGAMNLIVDPVRFSGIVTAAAPAVAAIPGGSTVYAQQFSGAAVNELFFSVVVPEWSRNDGFSLEFVLHWGPTTAAAGNLVWNIDYQVSDPGTAFAGPAVTVATASTPVAAGGVADAHISTAFTAIAGSALKSPTATDGVSSMMLGRLWRNPPHANDTYAAAAWLWRLEARLKEGV